MGRNFFQWKFEREKNGSFYCKFKFISIISFCLRFGRFFALTPASTQTITVCLRNRFSLHLHPTYTMASNVRRKKPVKQKKINDLCTSATEAVISAQQLLLLYTHTHNVRPQYLSIIMIDVPKLCLNVFDWPGKMKSISSQSFLI